ncbi:MAG: hypothetical protein A3F68_04460 [Acidobacteria bacterium RIFCSPLOWO2_12_FULL_54_10]|nr:MAG: hypothetical protein A3F68_04460 [Acidobacteria bacterium RIFCSPLOWO2_12_FULL_54_10]
MENDQEILYWTRGRFSFGEITVCCSDQGVREIRFASARQKNGRRKTGKTERVLRAAGSSQKPGARLARKTLHELKEYEQGGLKRFTVPIDTCGTPFEKMVWEELLRIPYGKTASYGEVARKVGNPRGARAVGMANNKNPIPIIVPCHRVIASDGKLSGYAGGLRMKTQLLRLEQGAL